MSNYIPNLKYLSDLKEIDGKLYGYDFDRKEFFQVELIQIDDFDLYKKIVAIYMDELL